MTRNKMTEQRIERAIELMTNISTLLDELYEKHCEAHKQLTI